MRRLGNLTTSQSRRIVRRRPTRNTEQSATHFSWRTKEYSKHFSTNASASVIVERHDHQKGRKLPQDGLSLGDFVQQSRSNDVPLSATRPLHESEEPRGTFYIKTYGCQMNVSDSDIVRAVLLENGYREATMEDVAANVDSGTTNGRNKTKHKVLSTPESTADIILTNTCAIREKAEEKVWQRLFHLRKNKNPDQIVGVLGCMAERLQNKLLEENVADLVVGPDAYRDLPKLLEQITSNSSENAKPLENQQKTATNGHQGTQDISAIASTTNQQPTEHQKQRKREKKKPRPKAINVDLSTIETYEDIMPIRSEETANPHSAFVSIQRGCSNRCSFCIVPFTRGGKERSRPFQSIIEEVAHMVETQNLKEVVLLGQNVNSYHDRSPQALEERPELNILSLSNEGFRSRIKRPNIGGYRFVDLVEAVSEISPELRIRYTSPHPKDYPLELLQLMAERPNICSQLHMPAQSGSTDMLKRMKRGYTREAYIDLIDSVRSVIPDVAISSDFIAGFCDETEDEHRDTLSLLEYVEYEQAFLFAYSMRDKTHASRAMQDNVAADVKQRRLQELIDVYREKIHAKNKRVEVGKLRLVLVEGPTKKQNSDSQPGKATWHGRTDQNKRILFDVEKEAGSALRAAKVWNEDNALQLLQQQQHETTELDYSTANNGSMELNPGDYAVVSVTEAKGHTLRGRVLWKTSISKFARFESEHMKNLRAEDLRLLQENLSPEYSVKEEERTPLINNA